MGDAVELVFLMLPMLPAFFCQLGRGKPALEKGAGGGGVVEQRLMASAVGADVFL